MVRKVPTKEMPQDRHLTGLYDDILGSMFISRIERSDEMFDEVQTSGWPEAPETPDEFKKKKLLSGVPVTERYDNEKTTDIELRNEVKKWPPKAQKVAKAIQKEFGVDGDRFTYKEVVDLGFNRNSLSNYFTNDPGFEESGYVVEDGRKDKSKAWRWVKSIKEDDV